MRVALFCNDDLTTNLIFSPVFDVPDIEIVGVYFVRNVNCKRQNKIAGIVSMLRKMHWSYWVYLVATNGLFKLFEKLTLWLKLPAYYGTCVSLRRLAQQHHIACEEIADFGDTEFIAHIRSLQLDLLLIRVGAILKPEMLAAPKLTTWCVHSSLMPSFKGIAGELHALRTENAPIGSTVFLVTPKLDEGPPLAQVTITRDEKRSVFEHMLRNNVAASVLLRDMLLNLKHNTNAEYALPGLALPASYFSWPQAAHMKEARQRGLRLIYLREWAKLLMQSLRLNPTPIIKY